MTRKKQTSSAPTTPSLSLRQQWWEKHRSLPWSQRLYYLHLLSYEEQPANPSWQPLLRFEGGSWLPRQFYRLLFLLNVPILLDLLYYGYWLPGKKTVQECVEYIDERRSWASIIGPLIRINAHIVDGLIAPFLICAFLIQSVTSFPLALLRLWAPQLNRLILSMVEFCKDYLLLGALKGPLYTLLDISGQVMVKLALTPLRFLPFSYYIGGIGVLGGMGLFVARMIYPQEDPQPLGIPTSLRKRLLPDSEGNTFFKTLFLIATMMLLPLTCLALPAVFFVLTGARFLVKNWRYWQAEENVKPTGILLEREPEKIFETPAPIIFSFRTSSRTPSKNIFPGYKPARSRLLQRH